MGALVMLMQIGAPHTKHQCTYRTAAKTDAFVQEDEAELLSQALRLSLADQNNPPGAPVENGSTLSASSSGAARPASRLVPRSEYVPQSVAAMTDECAPSCLPSLPAPGICCIMSI